MVGITFDTSFYIGAFNSRGIGSRLLGIARAGQIRIDISEPIIAETIRVLRDRFEWDGYSLHDTRQKLLQVGNLVTPTRTLDVITEDPPDNRILECAVTAGSDYILTWDKDLLRRGEYEGIKILTPAQYVECGRG